MGRPGRNDGPLPSNHSETIMVAGNLLGSAMARRWIALLAGGLGMALLGSGCSSTPTTPHLAFSAATARPTTAGPKGEARATVPSQGDVNLAEVIEDIGLSAYSDVFAGAEQLPDGQAAVHVIFGRDTAFRAALP